MLNARWRLAVAAGGVGVFGQVAEKGEELFGLAEEKVAGGQAIESAHCRAFGVGGPDDGAGGKIPVQEDGGLRHDQVGLEIFAAKAGVVVEVVKDDLRTGDWIHVGERRSVAGC